MAPTDTTQIECDHCGCEEMIAYQRDNSDGTVTIYIECDACGCSVVTAVTRG